MIEVDQYILLFIQSKVEEMEEFKDYIKTSKLPDRKTSYDEWETIYLNWAIGQEDGVEKADEMPKIYLSND
jgi:hypothetical protein